jgi:methyl-accepting chemotaxis protein
MKNISISARIYGLAAALLVIILALAAFAYISLADIGLQIAELKRVTDAADKVILADRDFTAMRVRASDYISDGLEEDRKKVQEYEVSTEASLSEAIALIRSAEIRTLAEQVLKSFQEFTSATEHLLQDRQALLASSAQLRDKSSQSAAAAGVADDSPAQRNAMETSTLAALQPNTATLAFATKAYDAAAKVATGEAGQRNLQAARESNAAVSAFVASKTETLQRSAAILRDQFINLRAKEVARALEIGTNVQQAEQTAKIVLVAVSGFAVLIGAILAFLIARGIINPLNKMTLAMVGLAGGDGTVEIPGLGATNEIGAMAKAVNVFKQNADMIAAMLKAEDTTREIGGVIAKAAGGDLTARVDLAGKSGFLHDIGGQVNQLLEVSHHAFRDFGEKARSTAISVGEASAAVGQVSDGARAQNQSLAQVATAVNESMAAIKDVSESTRLASEKAVSATRLVENGLTSVETLAQIVERIAQNSRKVNQITKLISQIANRTHILSLNAAIEAARAGEHGKGFVVVAQEVGKLAESAGQNANQIAEIVEQAANDTQAGNVATEQVRAAIKGISDETRVTTQMIHSSAAAIEEQRASMAQIGSTVNGLKDIANSNAAASEEITATMVQLSRLADDTRRRIDAFKMA